MTQQPDVVSLLLRSMQVSASLLLSEQYRVPWSVDVPATEELAAALGFPTGTHVIAFHLVRSGSLSMQSGEDIRTVNAGEVVILFQGDAHRVWSGEGASRTTLSMLLSGVHPDAQQRRGQDDAGQVQSSSQSESAAPTTLVCGAFAMRHTRLNPLFDALPKTAVLAIHEEGAKGWLGSIAQQLVTELEDPTPGSAFVVERLLELFCAASVREYMDGLGSEHSCSWFGALHDDAVLKALHAIHRDPAFAWSIAALASEASLSRSRLSERFTVAVGEPPMQYLAKWRMNTASRLLRETRHSVQRIANDVGYESLAAFSRAFKQHLGVPPATFRTNPAHWR